LENIANFIKERFKGILKEAIPLKPKGRDGARGNLWAGGGRRGVDVR